MQHYFFLVFLTSAEVKVKEKESIEISKILSLINNIEKYQNI